MDNALELASKTYVDVNIFDEEFKDNLEKLESLPESCWESAVELEKRRSAFEKNGIFPNGMIDNVVNKLKLYDDKDLSERLYGKNDEIAKLVNEFLHCM
jgi:glutamine synthetase